MKMYFYKNNTSFVHMYVICMHEAGRYIYYIGTVLVYNIILVNVE